MGDVDILFTNKRQFLLVFEGIEGRIAQEPNDLDKELRTHHIHLLILVANIDNPCVEVVIICLKHGHQNRIFTVLFSTVLVQFLVEIRILMLLLGPVGFILHLKHDGDNLHSIFITLAEDKVTFRPTCRDLVVLFKIGIWEGKTANLVEFTFRILLQTFTDSFCRLLGLEILVELDLFIGRL